MAILSDKKAPTISMSAFYIFLLYYFTSYACPLVTRFISIVKSKNSKPPMYPPLILDNLNHLVQKFSHGQAAFYQVTAMARWLKIRKFICPAFRNRYFMVYGHILKIYGFPTNTAPAIPHCINCLFLIICKRPPISHSPSSAFRQRF